MSTTEHSASEWRDLCRALIEKINYIAIGLFQWLRESKTDKEKLDHIGGYFVDKILSGGEENSIFSGIHFIGRNYGARSLPKDVVEKLFMNLSIRNE